MKKFKVIVDTAQTVTFIIEAENEHDAGEIAIFDWPVDNIVKTVDHCNDVESISHIEEIT